MSSFFIGEKIVLKQGRDQEVIGGFLGVVSVIFCMMKLLYPDIFSK